MVNNLASRNIYTFTKIAEDDDDRFPFQLQAIDDKGTVIFLQDNPAPGIDRGVFTGFGKNITTIVDTTDPRFSTFSGADINEKNELVFVGLKRDVPVPQFAAGVFNNKGDVITPIVVDKGFDSSSPFGRIVNDPEINNKGTVAFQDFGEEPGFFTINDDKIIKIADRNGPFQGFGGTIDINDSDEVAFNASLDSGGQGVFTSNGSEITTIALNNEADSSSPLGLGEVDGIDINNDGTVVVSTDLASGGEIIFTSNGGSIDTIADSSGQFNLFGGIAINERGEIAFGAVLDDGVTGIFTGPDPINDKVIASGDTLLGKTVSDVSTLESTNNILNNFGQIAFQANFEDGTSGIFRADLNINVINGTNRKDNLVGTSGPDKIKGFKSKDILTGLANNDFLKGGKGRDTLIGVDPNSTTPGLNEIDILTGGKGRDTFVLGDGKNIYYNDGVADNEGLMDYALITDNSNKDIIQLKGLPSDYNLVENFAVDGRTGTGIFFVNEQSINELIGLVDEVAGLELHSNDFKFV